METKKDFNFAKETWFLLRIAVPTVAVQFSVLFIFPQTASKVGRDLGTEYLAGFSLASLTGNLTMLSVMVGSLSAADTLMPRAYGTGQYEEVGRLAIRSFMICGIQLIIPIVPLLTATESIFDALGQDPVASKLASDWIKVYLLAVPSILLFRVTQSFLNAQSAVMPLVIASLVSCFLVHPFLLHVMIPWFGFLGSSLALTITQTTTVMLVFLYLRLRPEHEHLTWPGFSYSFIKESLKADDVLRFLSLSLGGVLSLSEWWFWETNCFIVGSLGIVPLCVHTIAYNIVPLLYMISLGIGIGLTVRMGNVLAADVVRAKKMAIWCMALMVIVATVVTSALYILRARIIQLFTSDQEVVQGCEAIWPKLCAYVFILYVGGANFAIHRALGLQWRMAIIFLSCLWCFTFPLIVYFVIIRKGGVNTLWTILPLCSLFMQIIFVLSYTSTVSWEEIGKSIHEESRRKSAQQKNKIQQYTEANEETQLL